MKTVLDAAVRDELTQRVNLLSKTSEARWGKMDVGQMLKHCVLWDEMVLQNVKYKRPLIGLLLGKTFLKRELRDELMAKNNPSVPALIVKERVSDIEGEKKKLNSLINQFSNYTLPNYSFVHPFFGKMTRKQVGLFVYKHSHHHLLQFGV